MATEEQVIPVDRVRPPSDFEVAGHRLRVLVEADERLDALIDTIEGATQELLLLYYIFCDNPVGVRVRDALVAARRRGVAVSLIVDGFGSEGTAEGFFEPLREAGATMCRFIPRYGRSYLLRNHQKMLVADRRIAVIGGFNISSAYFDPPEEQGWRDFGMRVEGEAVEHLAGFYRAMERWTLDPRARLRTLNRIVRQWSQKEGTLRWLFGGPTRTLSPWARAFRDDLRHGKRLDMIAAYFAPNPGAVRRLGRLARSGHARIITASKSDNTVTIAAARHCYLRLLRRRAEIFEYRPTKLHTKLYAIDDVSYVGSANFDIRSLYINIEVMLRIEDVALADRIRAQFDEEAAQSRPIDIPLIRARAGRWRRFKWRIAYFIVAVMDFSVTRRINFGGVGRELD